MRDFEKTDLPVGWTSTCVGELYQFEYGKSLTKLSRADAGDYPVYGSNGIVGMHDEYLIEGPVLIVGRKGAAGAVSYSPDNCWPIDTTYFIRDIPNLSLKFSYYLLQSLNLTKHEKSTAIPGLNRNDAYAEPVLLPPLPEQRRIVAKIEELFSELDKGIESFKTAREQLRVYRQVILNNAANGELSAQQDSRKTRTEKATVSLNDVVLSVGQGWSPRCLEHPSENYDTWGVIRTSAIQPLCFIETANKRFPDQLQPRPHLEIFPGDVLITRAGPRNRVGIACYVKSVRPRLMVCDKVYRIKVKQNKILPEYLVMLLNSPQVLEELETLKSGISDSGLNLTQDRFLSLKVVVPSLKTQKTILENLEQKLSNVAFFESQLEGSLETSETLRQSILKKAFSGQLVPQDPDDEPASKLLARIKEERSVVGTKQGSSASPGLGRGKKIQRTGRKRTRHDQA